MTGDQGEVIRFFNESTTGNEVHMLNTLKGMLIEYALSLPPLVLVFEFNPESLTRTRTITLRTGSAPGTRGGYDFTLPTETPRVAQGVTVQPERAAVAL